MKSLFATLLLTLSVTRAGASSAEFSDLELVELGQSYTRAINESDVDALNGLVSSEHLAYNIAEIAGDTADEKQELMRAFKNSIPLLNQRILGELERQDASAVYLRIHEYDGMRGPLVRYSLSEGYNYVLLLPVRGAHSGGEARIGDLYYATAGELLSETLGIAAKLVNSPSETFLGKLFGDKEINRELVSRFQQIGKLRQQNKIREAYDVLDEMEGSIRNHRLVLMNAIQLASQLDEELYRKELQRLAEHCKDDPRAAFTLLDHYFYEGDIDSALSTIDVMERTYGSDGVVFMLRANLEISRDRHDSALDFARTAVQLEPGNEDAQWTLLSALIQLRKFADGIEVLELLESEFSYAFERGDFDAEPIYREFVKSVEFDRWIDAT